MTRRRANDRTEFREGEGQLSDQHMTRAEAVDHIIRVTSGSAEAADLLLQQAIETKQVHWAGRDGKVTLVSRFDVMRTWPEATIKSDAAQIAPDDGWMEWGYAVEFIATALNTSRVQAWRLLAAWVEEGDVNYALSEDAQRPAMWLPISNWVGDLTPQQRPAVQKSDVMHRLARTPAHTEPAHATPEALHPAPPSNLTTLTQCLEVRRKVLAVLRSRIGSGFIPGLDIDLLADDILLGLVQ